MSRIQEALAAIFEAKKEIGELNQTKLAHAIGVRPAYVSLLLSGQRRLNDDLIEKICDALGIKLSDLDRPEALQELPRELRAGLEKLKRLYELSPENGFRSITNSIDDWLKILKSAPARASTGSNLPAIPADDVVFVDLGDGRPPVQISPTTKKRRKINKR